MIRYLLAASCLVPVVALAQPVPAISPAVTAAASASASVTPVPAGQATGTTTAVAPPVPATMPPPVHALSPSAKLNAKEQTSATIAAGWRNRMDHPARGEDGVVRWVYGSSLPSIVCSPLQVCDLALEPAEVVTGIHVGDKERWQITPAVTGFGAERVTHLVIKPSDAGLITSILVYTDKRTYSVKLISTQAQWTPMTAFNYPDSADVAWASYGSLLNAHKDPATSGAAPVHQPDPGNEYTISGSAAWRPVRVYSSAGKTYIEFPRAIQYGTSPALIGLGNDGGWFSSPSQMMVRYRILGNSYVVDGVVDRAALVIGVGGSQERVDIRRSTP